MAKKEYLRGHSEPHRSLILRRHIRRRIVLHMEPRRTNERHPISNRDKLARETLADGTREVVADCAGRRRQANKRGRRASALDRTRLAATRWLGRPRVDKRDGSKLKLVTEADCAETDDERAEIRRKLLNHLNAELETRADPYKDFARERGVSGANMSLDIDSVLVESSNLNSLS